MSKADVKKYIKSLDKSSLEELMMDLYSSRIYFLNYQKAIGDTSCT